ncbi:ankyrin repeat-containing domain protein [Lactarius pseudohatsudake]|nr:ankyrin repeat-containing domain protein [Lactarius pseudohatsudake]
MLLKRGVRIDAASVAGHTPLHRASKKGHVVIVWLLLQHGADISAQDEDYSTPLHLASSDEGLDVARLLLDHGANAEAEDQDGWTPLHLASSRGKTETVRLLLVRGANAEAKKKDGRTPKEKKNRDQRRRDLFDYGKLSHAHVLELGTSSLPPASAFVTVTALDWTLPTLRQVDVRGADAPDVLLVVDCVYHPALVRTLLTTLTALATPQHTTAVVAAELPSCTKKP